MRYKAYLIQGTNQGVYSGPPLIRQGNNFVDAQFPGVSDHHAYRTAAIGLTRLNDCTEIKDGIWIWPSPGYVSGDTFIVPESDEFFNLDIYLDAAYSTLPLSPQRASAFLTIFDIVKRLAIKYFKS